MEIISNDEISVTVQLADLTWGDDEQTINVPYGQRIMRIYQFIAQAQLDADLKATENMVEITPVEATYILKAIGQQPITFCATCNNDLYTKLKLKADKANEQPVD